MKLTECIFSFEALSIEWPVPSIALFGGEGITSVWWLVLVGLSLPFDLLVLPCWSMFSHDAKRLTSYVFGPTEKYVG